MKRFEAAFCNQLHSVWVDLFELGCLHGSYLPCLDAETNYNQIIELHVNKPREAQTST